MYYKSEDIDKLLEKLDIVEVVQEFVELKKAGANYKGLCPFHADTTPSFIVNPNKNICKCFVCNTGGNPITFYSKYKKVSFYEAVKELAQKYNVNIREQSHQKESFEIERYYEIMEESHKFYTTKIFSFEGRIALEYLSNRDLDTKLIKEHQLGYATEKWSELYDHLINKDYKLEELLNLGLVKKKEEHVYDAFRNRVIFPIYSTHGRIIAFGGRSLEKSDKIPKYINSPDTPIFKKGKNIYGIERAASIKDKNYSILMEGYMDVLSSCIYGFETSIAPLGTALTEEQAKLLKRYSNNVLIAFDMDKAGRAATERAAFMLKSQGFNIRVLEFKNFKDPDEFLKKNGREGFLQVVKNSLEIFDFLYNLYLEEYDIKNIISKQNFIEKFKEFFISLSSDLEKDMYLQKLSEKVGIDFDTLKKVLVQENTKKIVYKINRKELVENKEEIKNRKIYDLEISIIKMLLKNPEYYSFFQNKKMEFEITNKIFYFFEKKIKESLILNSINIVKELKLYIEEGDFTEAEKNNDLAEILVAYACESSKEENLKIFKSYFRYKLKGKNKKKCSLEKKIQIGRFQKNIEDSSSIEEFIKIYNINEELLNEIL